MTLRRKTLIIVGATLVGLILIMFAVSQGILQNSFSRLEITDTTENVERAQAALSDDLSNLNAIVGDWAPWDDTYVFVEDINNSYIENNLNDNTFANLRVNVMLFINSSGRLVFGKAFDLQNNQEVLVPEGLKENLSASNPLTYHSDVESKISGLILLPEGPMLISSQPILTSQNEGPIRGALIMGRLLDSEEIGRLAGITSLSLTLQNLDEPQMTSDFQAARSSLSGNTPIFVRPLDKKSVAGYTLINDVYGKPIMMLRVDVPREIYHQGQASQLQFILSVLVIGLVFGVVVLLLLRKSVLSPLSRLSAAVSSIGRTEALSARVPVTGKDELSSLAGEINRMLESLEQSHDKLQESEEKFKHLVEDMNDGYFVVQDLRIVFANACSAEMFGYPVKEVTGRTIEELLPHKEVKVLSEWCVRKLRGEAVSQRYETTLTRNDGTTVTVEFGAKRMYYAGRPAVSVVMRDVTTRRQIEEALRESDAKYRDVVERANDMIAIVQDTIIKYINTRSSKMLGYLPKQMIGTPIREYIHPDEFQRVISSYEWRIAGERVESVYETALLHSDGSRVDVELNAGVITYGGRPADLVIARDIRERKKAQEAIRQSEEHYSTLVRSLTDAVFKLKGKVITWCNDRVEEIYGYQADELIGKEAAFLFPEGANRSKFIEEVAGAMEKQGYFCGAQRVKKKNGSLVDIECTISQIHDTEPIELIAVVRDITERKKAEEALQESEERYRELVENANDVIYTHDLTGNFTSINKAGEEVTGYRRDEILGMNISRVLSPESLELARQMTTRKVSGGGETRYELEIIANDGHRVLLEVSSRLIFDGDKPVSVQGIARDVTERKRMEEKLHRLSDAVRMSTDSIVITDLEANIVDVNEATIKIQRASSKSELTGLEFSNFIAPEEQEKALRDLSRVIEEERVNNIRYHIMTRDGRKILGETNASIMKDRNGEAVGVVAVTRDITERKRMEDALRESEEKHRLYFENASDVICSIDTEGKILTISPSVQRAMGYTPEELIGKNIIELGIVTPETFERVLPDVLRVLSGERVIASEGEFITKDGTRKFGEISGAPVFSSDGKVIAIICVARDTTERKKMEEALKQSEQSYRVLFNSSLDGLVVLDAETMKVVLANATAARMAGFDSLQGIIGTDILSFLPLEERERAHKIIKEEVFKRDLRNKSEYRALGKDGKETWVSVVSTRTEYQGRMAALISIRDITKRKRMEEGRQIMEEQLRLAGRLAAVGELSAGVAHELNNPIAAIQGFAQLLTAREDLDETMRKDLDTIYRESKRAAKITQNLLSFARRQEPEKHLISLNEALEKTLELRVHMMKLNNIELVAELAPDLPNTIADFHQMQQVFINIINNAEQAMLEAHGRGRLVVKTRKSGDMIQISFADDGLGIPEENMHRIFDPFFTTKEVGEGTGLGLSICYGLVEAHGGRIYARSEFGQGATFVVEIPIVCEDRLIAEAALINPGSRGAKWKTPKGQY